MFKSAGIRRDVRDDEMNKDGPAIQCLLVEELALAGFEFANGRLS